MSWNFARSGTGSFDQSCWGCHRRSDMGIPWLTGLAINCQRPRFRRAGAVPRHQFDLYLSGQTATEICDRAIAGAFHDIGHGWECGKIVVYHERRARDCSQDSARAKADDAGCSMDSPTAIGGTIEGDPYCLPTMMVNWRVTRSAGRQRHWVRCFRSPRSSKSATRESPHIAVDQCLHDSVASWVSRRVRTPARSSGRTRNSDRCWWTGLLADVRQQMSYSAYCDTLASVTFANSIKQPPRRRRSKAQSR